MTFVHVWLGDAPMPEPAARTREWVTRMGWAYELITESPYGGYPLTVQSNFIRVDRALQGDAVMYADCDVTIHSAWRFSGSFQAAEWRGWPHPSLFFSPGSSRWLRRVQRWQHRLDWREAGATGVGAFRFHRAWDVIPSECYSHEWRTHTSVGTEGKGGSWV